MKTRRIYIVAALFCPIFSFGQTELNKTIPVKAGQTINMKFDYPELVKVSTWDRNEIVVTGSVSINAGENDDAFIFENSVNGNVIDIRSSIRDLKKLPQRITITRDGQKIMFKDKAELKKYQQEHGQGYNRATTTCRGERISTLNLRSKFRKTWKPESRQLTEWWKLEISVVR
jgi:hypothetical protein